MRNDITEFSLISFYRNIKALRSKRKIRVNFRIEMYYIVSFTFTQENGLLLNL